MTISTREDDAVTLRCPHCDAPVGEPLVVRVRARLGRRFAYGCANCHKLLAVTHRKGFWMG